MGKPELLYRVDYSPLKEIVDLIFKLRKFGYKVSYSLGKNSRISWSKRGKEDG